MKNYRKNLWHILNDNLINVFNLANIALIVAFIINKTPLYIIPLVLVLGCSVLNFYLNYANYRKDNVNKSTVHLLVDGLQVEKPFNKLKIGDQLFVYPNDKIEFVGVVRQGIIFINESKITGRTKPVKKGEGDYIGIGSTIISGTAVMEITNLDGKLIKDIGYQSSSISKKIKWFNLLFGGLTLALLIASIIITSNRGALDLNNTAQACILILPGLANVIITLFLYLDYKKLLKNDVNVLDQLALSEISDVDVVCLNKTGIITSGEYEILKTIPLSTSAFTSNPENINSAFAQVVSDVIKTNSERGGWFNSLNEYFHYDVAKIVIDSASLRDNGLYSVASFKGGKTYAIGVPENFDLANQETVYNAVNQYRFMGYRILLLVESKNPIKSGLIDGKCIGIGVIVLQEKIRNNITEVIKYFQNKGKLIKVISGDEKECVGDVCRKVGIDIANKITSLDGMSIEQLEVMVESQDVFTDASMYQKTYIVQQLKKNGHKVLFIGDDDYDSNALKEADVAISLSSSSESAKKCSQIVVNDDFKDYDSLFKIGNKQKVNINSVLDLFYSQSIFVFVATLAFMIANAINETLINPFTFPHLVLWFTFGILIPSIVIMLDKQSTGRKVHFITTLVANSLALIIPVTCIYIFQIIQYNGGGFFNIPSDLTPYHERLLTSQVANNLSYLILLIVSMFILYRHLTPMNKFRLMVFLSIILLPVIYIVLLVLDIDVLSPYVGIDTTILTVGNYFTGGISALVASSLYIAILDIIDIFKGESSDVKN